MSRMHILEQISLNLYNVVVHASMPAGNNFAIPTPISWSQAMVSAGLAVTQMTVGNDPGQISQAEANQINAGTVIEASFAWQDDPNFTLSQRLADLNLRAQQAVDEIVTKYQQRLKMFGSTVL